VCSSFPLRPPVCSSPHALSKLHLESLCSRLGHRGGDPFGGLPLCRFDLLVPLPIARLDIALDLRLYAAAQIVRVRGVNLPALFAVMRDVPLVTWIGLFLFGFKRWQVGNIIR